MLRALFLSTPLAFATVIAVGVAHASGLSPEPTRPMALAPAPIPLKTGTPSPLPASPDLSTAKIPAADAGNARRQGGSWRYDGKGGPDNWGDLSPEYRTCSAGRAQSPVDIDTPGPARLAPVAFRYKLSAVELANNGHAVQANYGEGSYITVGGERYELMQFHFHTPSEHRITGRSFPMEIHFVHRNAVGRLAVVGVLVTPGESNLAARQIWDSLPAQPGGSSGNGRTLMNARDLLPDDAKYFRYGGSLTTPPCSEQVEWFVLQHPVTFSIEQIARIRGIMGANARPVQPRHGRYLLQGTDG
ncbi:MAG: carbonic anhydrase family protein [Rhodospirillaceae bacterium]